MVHELREDYKKSTGRFSLMVHIPSGCPGNSSAGACPPLVFEPSLDEACQAYDIAKRVVNFVEICLSH
jgi:hypothetical protein